MKENELIEELDIIITNMENGTFNFNIVLRNLVSLKKQLSYEGIDVEWKK